MELVHVYLVKEYIVQLSKRQVVLKTAEQQQQLARQVLANANLIEHFCTQNVSPGHLGWLPSLLWASPDLISSDLNLSGPLGALLEKGQPPSNQACACRAPGPPGCTKPSLHSPRSFACKTPVPSRLRWPLTPPATPTSGENRAPQDLGSQYGPAGPHRGQSLARLHSAPLGAWSSGAGHTVQPWR